MSTSDEKLQKDLEIIELMAQQMRAYLNNDLLLPMTHPDAPQVTLAGYLMRVHRLQALRNTLLDGDERARLDQAVRAYQQVTGEKRAQFDQKIAQERQARLRQWREYLRDLEEGAGNAVYYHTAVETRLMLTMLLNESADAEVTRPLETLDQTLRRAWQPGPFIWPAAWRPAYPENNYWWLYGEPRAAAR